MKPRAPPETGSRSQHRPVPRNTQRPVCPTPRRTRAGQGRVPPGSSERKLSLRFQKHNGIVLTQKPSNPCVGLGHPAIVRSRRPPQCTGDGVRAGRPSHASAAAVRAVHRRPGRAQGSRVWSCLPQRGVTTGRGARTPCSVRTPENRSTSKRCGCAATLFLGRKARFCVWGGFFFWFLFVFFLRLVY